MADVNNAVALGVQTPNFIGTLRDAADIQRAQAQTAGIEQTVLGQKTKYGILQDYTHRVQGGEAPESAIVSSGLSTFDPASADQALKNVGQQRSLSSLKQYQESGDPNSLKVQGPDVYAKGLGAVGDQRKLAANAEYAKTGDPNSLAILGPEAKKQAYEAMTAGGDATVKQYQILGQIGSMMVADPSPEGRRRAADFAHQYAQQLGQSPLQIEQYVNLPPDQFSAMGRQLQAVGQTANDYIANSGAKTFNEGQAKAATTIEKVSPGESLKIPGGAQQAIQPGFVPGQRQASAPVGNAISQAAAANGLDPAFMQRAAQIESGMDPGNVTGSYKGLYQLSDAEFRKYGGGDIMNPVDNANAAAAKFADEAKQFQQAYGRAPTATDMYLMHQQGTAGYAAHLSNPDEPAWKNMLSTGEGQQKGEAWAKRAIWGNVPDDVKKLFPGGVDSVSSRDFVNLWNSKVSGQPVAGLGQQGIGQAAQGQSQQVADNSGLNPLLFSNPPMRQSVDQNGYQTVGGMSLQQKTQAEGVGKALSEDYTKAKTGAQDAQALQLNLGNLSSALEVANGKGLYEPGTGASTRYGIMKALNTASRAVGGGDLFDADKVASGEEAGKITTRLGFDLSRTLGSREAMQIVHEAIGAVPGLENTPQGARVVSAGINAAAQRSVDYYNFLNNWRQQHDGDTEGADIAFNRMLPPSHYVGEVSSLARIKPEGVQFLIKNKDNPEIVDAFNQQFGPSMSRYFIGR